METLKQKSRIDLPACISGWCSGRPLTRSQSHAHESIRSMGLGLSDFGVLEVLLHKGPLPVNALGVEDSADQRLHQRRHRPVGEKGGWSSAETTRTIAARASFI